VQCELGLGPVGRGRAGAQAGDGGGDCLVLDDDDEAQGPTTFPDRGAAETRLKADFGFSEIKDGSATWTLIELGKVHAALSRLSGGERTALAGVALVREHILPFTEYARSNWPAVPDEFFAKAFSLFHTDPDFMQTNYKPLFDWFASGEHLK